MRGNVIDKESEASLFIVFGNVHDHWNVYTIGVLSFACYITITAIL